MAAGSVTPHLRRVLPPSWQGPSRQARCRRSRARRAVAGLLLAAALLCVMAAVRPATPQTRTVSVAARDLGVGHRLAPADVRQVRWPKSADLPGTLGASGTKGQVLVAPIGAGEPFTASRLRDARSWAALAGGQVVVGVPASYAGLGGILQPGDRVDVIDAAKAAVVADRALVLAAARPAPAADQDFATPGDRSGEILLAVPASASARIAAALSAAGSGAGGGLLLALHPHA